MQCVPLEQVKISALSLPMVIERLQRCADQVLQAFNHDQTTYKKNNKMQEYKLQEVLPLLVSTIKKQSKFKTVGESHMSNMEGSSSSTSSLSSVVVSSAMDIATMGDIVCATCRNGSSVRGNKILLCDGDCERGFHQLCLYPQMTRLPPPKEDWFCSQCTSSKRSLEPNATTETGRDKPEGMYDASNEASKKQKTASDEPTPSTASNIGRKVTACVGCKLQDGDTTVTIGLLVR